MRSWAILVISLLYDNHAAAVITSALSGVVFFAVSSAKFSLLFAVVSCVSSATKELSYVVTLRSRTSVLVLRLLTVAM